MLEHVIPHLTKQQQLIEQQKLDGAVDHPEFDPDYDVSGWPLLSDPTQRAKLESFVLKKCIPKRHRFKMADGSEGVVYFDGRGRAVHCPITEVPDTDLVRLAQEAGKRLPGKKDPKKPKTSKKNHGYTPPVQEEALLEATGGVNLGKLSPKMLSSLYTSKLIAEMMKAMPPRIKGGKHETYTISGGAGANGEGVNRADVPVTWNVYAVVSNKPFLSVDITADIEIAGRARADHSWTLKWDGSPLTIAKSFKSYLKDI